MGLYEYECALTGVTEQGAEDNDSDGQGDLPVGWTAIHIVRRQYNPKWMLVQQIKEGMIAQLASRYPEEIRDAQRVAITVQIEAQFHAYESGIPMYILDTDETVYVSASADATEALNEIREKLDLEHVEVEEDGGDDREESEESEAAEAAEQA